MTFRTLILRSLRYHWRAHVGVVLGAAVGSAALIGALVVGDSVWKSLRNASLARLGPTTTAISSGDRFFTTALLNRLEGAATFGVHSREAQTGPGAFLMLPCAVARQDGAARANQAAVIGVADTPFGRISMFTPDTASGLRLSPQWNESIPLAAAHTAVTLRLPAPGTVMLNTALAEQLNVRTGDVVIVRVHKPSLLPRDAVIADQSDASVALRLQVHAIVPADAGGNFGLASRGTPPLNAFVGQDELSRALDLAGRANVLAMGGIECRHQPSWFAKARYWIGEALRTGRVNHRFIAPPAAHPLSPLEAALFWSNHLEHAWLPADAELKIVPLSGATNQTASTLSKDGFTGEPLRPGTNELRALARIFDKEEPRPPRAVPGIQPQVLEELHRHAVNLQTRRVFIDSAVAQAALRPSTRFDLPKTDYILLSRISLQESLALTPVVTNGIPMLTYLVNLIQAGDRATPYSMVTATKAPYVPADLRDDEILVNEWLAEDLAVKPGDSVALSYFVVDSGSTLLERTNRFRVRGVVPLSGIHADRTLMPEFPGIAKAEKTQDWDTGFPLTHKIRDKDEDYWKKHRGTPKAFISLAAGQGMWANRFGSLTAIRYPLPMGTSEEELAEIVRANLVAGLKAETVGLRFEPVREQALKAANEAQDFGQLFLGFSFFLIAAALILMALLFQFGLEQRATEVGTLLALGFTPKQVRRLFLWEGVMLAAVGGVIGVAGGLGYAWAMLRGLGTIWRDAVNASALSFHASGTTLLIGTVASLLVSAFTLWLTLRKLARQSARELLAGEVQSSGFEVRRSRFPMRMLPLAGALWLLAWAMARGDTSNPGVFFGAGSLLLIAGIAFTASWLRRLALGEGRRHFTLGALGFRGCTRRRSRSLAVAGLLASGTFLVVAIGAFKMDANANAWKRSSGTGGFALIGESTLPIVRDLNTKEGREFYSLDEAAFAGVSFVPMRVRDGDDASCLNLNRAQRPRLLGVKPEWLAERRAFAFAKVGQASRRSRLAKSSETGETPVLLSPWSLLAPSSGREDGSSPSSILRPPSSPSEIPAIGDAASIQWAMGKKVGDALDYVDERGQPFKVRIVGAVANSILQGSLLIDEDEFKRRFPGESGYRMFLIDAPSNRVSEVSATLSRAFQDVGLELTPATRRLAQFNAVQNTYLNTFQVLGGLGLLLGTAGLGVVVLRNVLERRSEFAVLLAVGFLPGALRRLVLSEHGALLVLGLLIGMVAALIAILPTVLSPAAEFPYRSLSVTLAGLLASGMLWSWLATWLALRGQLLAALRDE